MSSRFQHILALANSNALSLPQLKAPPAAAEVEFTNIIVGAVDSPKVLPALSRIWVLADLTDGDVTLYLPENPSLSDEVVVEDAKMLIGTHALTIQGTGKMIDDSANIELASQPENGAVLKLRFNGTIWKIN